MTGFMSDQTSLSSSLRPMISVIVTAHRESLLIHRTLKSVYAAIELAAHANISCELLVVLDRGDEETRSYIDRFPIQRHRTIEVDMGDPGSARNVGAQHVTGKYVAYLDADDLFCSQWLMLAYKYAEDVRVQRLILHPEYNVCFEAMKCLVQYGGYPTSGVSPLGLAAVNYWTSILFFQRSLLADRQFSHLEPASGFGYEDWHFVAEHVAIGAEVHTVPGTCNFVRRKLHNSVLNRHSQSKALLPPTMLLDPVIVARQHATSAASRPKTSGYRKLKREVKRVFRQVLPRRLSEAVLSPETPIVTEQPRFVVEACRAIHAIEPKLYPSADQFSVVYHPMQSGCGIAEPYRMLCRSCDSRPTHVFLVPWLKTGGADLVTLNYVQAVCQASDRNRVTVVATQDSDSPWSARLPRDVSFIPFGEYCRNIDPALRAQLLATFLVQLQPGVIHNINSADGFIAFRDHGTALQQRSRLFACAFCEDITEDGRIVGYAFDHLPDCFPYLSGVLTENERIVNKLADQYGFGREKFHLHYQPTAAIARKPKKPSERLSVLWAGRLDRQKRPDLLKAIAEQLQGSAIDLNFYGSSILDQADETNRWSSLPNLFYRGPFDRFESLPLDEFDVFLHTSQWDGMPNVLLEAMAAGLAVVGSGVGGVPELIEDGVTGFCVTPFDDVDAYCKALRTLHADRSTLARLAAAGKELVDNRHSRAAFQRTVSRVPGYLTPPAFEDKRQHAGTRAA
jgi:glycosyltransferase involved in cell wall biosynthesis